MDSDSDLLQRFAATGDQAAFTELVSRHAGTVRGVAWRRTQDWNAAEEVAQNVFAILARKAGAPDHESLAGWPHRAAVLESVNAVRKAARCQRGPAPSERPYGKPALLRRRRVGGTPPAP